MDGQKEKGKQKPANLALRGRTGNKKIPSFNALALAVVRMAFAAGGNQHQFPRLSTTPPHYISERMDPLAIHPATDAFRDECRSLVIVHTRRPTRRPGWPAITLEAAPPRQEKALPK